MYLRRPQGPTHGNGTLFLVPTKAEPMTKARRVQALLRSSIMRRTKKDMLLGEPLVVLPKKRIQILKLYDESGRRFVAISTTSRGCQCNASSRFPISCSCWFCYAHGLAASTASYPLHAPLWEICRLRAKPATTAQLLVAAISLSAAEGRLADVQPIAVWHWLL
jgi:hypothetical protein